MELILLGTGGGPIPSEIRGQPANAIVHHGNVYVVDCGNGVAMRLVGAGLQCSAIRAIFLTHHHADHNADHGILPLFAWIGGVTQPIEIFGPAPIFEMNDHFIQAMTVELEDRERFGSSRFSDAVHVNEVHEGAIYSDGGLTVTATRVDHGQMDAFAYRFDADGRSIVISGDTAPCDKLIALAQNADLLIHEAFLPEELRGMLSGMFKLDPSRAEGVLQGFAVAHCTASDAGRVANEARVGKLVLSHLIPGDGVGDSEWLAGAKEEYSGPIDIGHDLDTLSVS